MSEETTAVIAALTQLGAPFRLFQHEGSLRSLAQAAAERDQRPEQVVRSLLFRLNQGEYVMVLAAGPGQLSWRRLREYFGQSRLTMASRAGVLQVTGYELGAVAPFGLPGAVPIYLDQSVLAETEISLGSGRRGLALIMMVSDLVSALGEPPVVDFIEKDDV